MSVEYDPYSDAAMRDPTDLYRQLRALGKPYYIEKYNAWALARFDDVWVASTKHEADVDFNHGQTPGQLLLGEPVPHTFMTMNGADHRRWRGLLRPHFMVGEVRAQRERIRSLVREIMDPLLERGEMDVYADLSNRILCINAGYNLGLQREDAEYLRSIIDDMLHRDPGQVGMVSERNQKAATTLYEYMTAHVQALRRNPESASMLAKKLMEAEIDGYRLSDDELVAYFFSLLMTGSETTPMATAGAFYYLAKHPEQRRQLLADKKLALNAFRETCRYDQPTNMLARRARNSFELNGAKIEQGQNLLYIYASANRDETVFERPDQFDINREMRRDLIFGAGGHACLGLHLAMMVGVMIIQELLGSIHDYELVEERCERAYGEHLSGFLRVPIRFEPCAPAHA